MKRRRSTRLKAPKPSTNQAKWIEEEGIEETPDIGKDAMFEILIRLPIKNLLRCKTVSKYWFRLISNPEFINFRLKFACDDPYYAHHKRLHIDVDSANVFQQSPYYPTLRDPGCDLSETAISHPMEFWAEEYSHSVLTFVGSCRGLVCIAGLYNRVVVWNPVLRKCKRLPYFGRGSKVAYGFGYDESSDDFKVVGIRNTPKIVVKIYSARTNSWKKLPEDGFAVYVDRVDGHGCILNGKLHWAMRNKRIFTIDLSSERFGVMDPPDCLRVAECRAWSIHAVGKNIAMFAFHHKKAYLCMMERYDGKESWTRIDKGFTDSQPAYLDEADCPGHNHFMYVAPSELGEAVRRIIPILGHMTGNAIKAFLFYCVKYAGNYLHDPLGFFASCKPSELPVIVYVESLIWPFPTSSRA